MNVDNVLKLTSILYNVTFIMVSLVTAIWLIFKSNKSKRFDELSGKNSTSYNIVASYVLFGIVLLLPMCIIHIYNDKVDINYNLMMTIFLGGNFILIIAFLIHFYTDKLLRRSQLCCIISGILFFLEMYTIATLKSMDAIAIWFLFVIVLNLIILTMMLAIKVGHRKYFNMLTRRYLRISVGDEEFNCILVKKATDYGEYLFQINDKVSNNIIYKHRKVYTKDIRWQEKLLYDDCYISAWINTVSDNQYLGIELIYKEINYNKDLIKFYRSKINTLHIKIARTKSPTKKNRYEQMLIYNSEILELIIRFNNQLEVISQSNIIPS